MYFYQKHDVDTTIETLMSMYVCMFVRFIFKPIIQYVYKWNDFRIIYWIHVHINTLVQYIYNCFG